jgi:hypothetical protein
VQKETGLIVGYDGSAWRDELSRDWSDQVRFSLPDFDVFAIDADASTPTQLDAFAHVGTVNYALTVNPVNNKIYVANTDANNRVRFAGTRDSGDTTSTVRGNLHQARITVIDPAGPFVTPRHLNKHIDYSDPNPPLSVKETTLAIPMGMAVSADGQTLYVTAMGSGKIGVFDASEIEDGSFVPNSTSHITLSGGGPTGIVLDELHDFLFVLTRFNNSIAVIDPGTGTELEVIELHNPEPASVVAGRPLLFDAHYTSGNGEASCGVCHVGADKDELAWDLGDPSGSSESNRNPGNGRFIDPFFHPMKGPMMTQTLRGMDNHGPMHWRGDRSAGDDPGDDPLDEEAAFKKFNPAFVGLLGRDSELTAGEMQAFTDFILQLTPPPNPIRALDDTFTPMQAAGNSSFFTQPQFDSGTCDHCHTLDPEQGFFGTSGLSTFDNQTQIFKVPMLRNMYEKVGMFGRPGVRYFNPGDNAHKGDQIRGFGYLNDGSVDTLHRFFNATFFHFSDGAAGETERRNMEQFMFAFDSNLKPVVGQQVTLTSTSGTDVEDRVDLLAARAAAGDAELVVKGTVNSEARGWLRQANGSYQSDKSAEAPLSEQDLLAMASSLGQELTFTAVPAGTGTRIGLDRDRDTVLNADDNCMAAPNTAQQDSDDDGIGNVCDANVCHPN